MGIVVLERLSQMHAAPGTVKRLRLCRLWCRALRLWCCSTLTWAPSSKWQPQILIPFMTLIQSHDRRLEVFFFFFFYGAYLEQQTAWLKEIKTFFPPHFFFFPQIKYTREKWGSCQPSWLLHRASPCSSRRPRWHAHTLWNKAFHQLKWYHCSQLSCFCLR